MQLENAVRMLMVLDTTESYGASCWYGGSRASASRLAFINCTHQTDLSERRRRVMNVILYEGRYASSDNE